MYMLEWEQTLALAWDHNRCAMMEPAKWEKLTFTVARKGSSGPVSPRKRGFAFSSSMLSIPYYRLIDAVVGMDQYPAPSSGAVKILLEPSKYKPVAGLFAFLKCLVSLYGSAKTSTGPPAGFIALTSLR